MWVPNGIAVEDVASAAYVYERAVREGYGQKLKIYSWHLLLVPPSAYLQAPADPAQLLGRSGDRNMSPSSSARLTERLALSRISGGTTGSDLACTLRLMSAAPSIETGLAHNPGKELILCRVSKPVLRVRVQRRRAA